MIQLTENENIMVQGQLPKENEIQRPDFGAIIDELRVENNFYSELQNKAYQITKTVKQFVPIEQKTASEPSPEPVTIVDYLWQQIGLLRRNNRELEVTLNHLQSIVGS